MCLHSHKLDDTGPSPSVTFLPIQLCYVSKTFHTALMLLSFMSCIWNGANYYIDIFSRRYVKQFEETSVWTSDMSNSPATSSTVCQTLGQQASFHCRRGEQNLHTVSFFVLLSVLIYRLVNLFVY